MTGDIEVRDDPERSRYEATLDGEVAGWVEYIRSSRRVVFTHTFVDPDFRGLGIAGALAGRAIGDAEEDGTRTVVPRCPYIASWMDDHPRYAHLRRGTAGAPRPASDTATPLTPKA